MCWSGKIKDKRIASRNIIVYKMLRKMIKNGKTFYQAPVMTYFYGLGHKYCMGKINPVEIPASFDINSIEINEGYHCYAGHVLVNADKLSNSIFIYSGDDYTKLIGGFSINSRLLISPAFSQYGGTVLVKCTIPKGVTYYMNGDGEIVTDTIIIEEELEIPNNIIIDITEE